jgi:pimeloyl-ACP methyl ester carboxylesterase
LEPVSHFFYSDRLKLQFWDWGTDGKPVMILVHGGLDHARSWDWVARALREEFHVYALDLRGHGNSAWAPGALYSVAEHVLDLSGLADVVRGFPVSIIGHSLGALVSLLYAGIYPDRVAKVVAIEGVGLPPFRRVQQNPAADRIRNWIERVRGTEQRIPHSYPDLAAAVARMKEANPEASSVLGHITAPVLLFWGRESFAMDPDTASETAALRDRRIVKVDKAGHWLHHDQLEVFLQETKKFLGQ